MQAIIKTETDAFREFFSKIAGTIKVIFEEGTQSAWLYQLIKPLVTEVVVCDVRKHKQRGNHADKIDAEQLAQLLRLGNVTSVYKGDTPDKRSSKSWPATMRIWSQMRRALPIDLKPSIVRARSTAPGARLSIQQSARNGSRS